MSETEPAWWDSGEVAAWNIKGFSVALREAVTKAARQQDCTIADWLHAHFHKHGIDGIQVETVKIDPVSPDAPDDLQRLVASAALLSQHRDGMHKELHDTLARALISRARLAAAPAVHDLPQPHRQIVRQPAEITGQHIADQPGRLTAE